MSLAITLRCLSDGSKAVPLLYVILDLPATMNWLYLTKIIRQIEKETDKPVRHNENYDLYTGYLESVLCYTGIWALRMG